MRFRFLTDAGKAFVSLAFVFAFATLVAAQSVPSTPAVAPAPVAIAPGDAAVSGFSGVELAGGSVPPGVNPLDVSVITLANPTLKVLDLSHIGGEALGQLLPPNVKFAVPAKDIGQVFGIAFDEGTAGGPPNIYAASTSAYGFNIVGAKPGAAGKPVRLKAGAPGAKFMEGQFGPGATPGAIWKINGTTGKSSLFAETADGGISNSGPALGDIAIDPKSNSLFASDLDTGLIYRFPLASDGKSPIVFDHGKAGRPAAKLSAVDDDKRRMDIASPAFKPDDPQTWGITPPERRVDGLAVREGRLYYAVAAGLEIWSVSVAADGTFGTDPRREVVVKTDRPAFVSDIVFDADGRMTLALRGQAMSPFDYRKLIEPASGGVLRYLPESPDDPATPTTWVADPQSYAIGAMSGKSTAAGGVALGYPYGADGAIDLSKCSGTFAATGDTLPVAGDSFVNGAQMMPADLVRPAEPAGKSVFVDFDAMQNDKSLIGHVGDVEIFQRCDGSQFPAMAGDPGAVPDSGAAATPGGFGGGAGGGGGGVPGEALPAEGVPGEGLAEAAVDPNAPNVAEQQCQPAEIGKALSLDEAAADGRSVKNVSEPTCTPNPDGKTTKCRFPVAFENKTDAAQDEVIKFRTEPPPQTPLHSETPGNSSGIRGDGTFFIGSEKVEAGQTGTPVVFAGDYLVGQEPVGQPSVDRAPRVRPKEPIKCQEPQNGERVCSVPLSFENPSQLDNPKIEILSNTAPKSVTISRGDQNLSPAGTRNVGATITTFDTPFPANSKEDLVATVVLEAGAGTGFTAKISDESTAAAEKLAEERAAAAAAGPAASCTTADTTQPDGAPSTPGSDSTGPPIGPSANAPGAPGGSPAAPSVPVTVSKRAVGQCSPIDGNCEFEVTVKNNTNQDIPGEISINEAGATRAGEKTIPATLGAAPNAPWSCSGSKDFTCTHPGPLRANSTEILRVTMKAFGNEGKQNGVSNCAQLSGGDPGTGNQDLANLLRPTSVTEDGLAMAATPQTATCSASAECVWDVTLTNTGTQPLTGPLRLSSRVNTMLSAKPRVTASRVVAGDGLVCPNTPGEPEDCSAPDITLAPGESRTFSMGVTASVPGDSPSSVLRSTFIADIGPEDKRSSSVVANVPLDTPILGSENKLPDGTPSREEIAALTPSACATALSPKPVAAGQPPPPPTEGPDLVVTKLLQGGAKEDGVPHCPVDGPCVYNIVVTNRGPGTYKGPLTVEDKITPPPGNAKPESIRKAAGNDAAWNCQPPSDFGLSCTIPEITLEKGKTFSLLVEVVAGSTWKNLSANVMENCAELGFDNKPADNPDEPKFRSCKIIKLDPFDVKVAKSGGQSCQPGKECKFEFDIFNPGNIPHDDPVTVSDKLTGIGDAPIVSLTAASGADPFPCSPPPTQAPFTCTGHMRLEVGEHNKYAVVIRIPEDAAASGAFTNCAGVGKDAAGATPGGTDDVCHTTRLEPPAPDAKCPEGWTGEYPTTCTPPQVSGGPSTTERPEPATCFGGMILVSASECRCPAPTILNGSTGTCVAAPDCPDGYAGEYPNCQLAPTLTGGSNPSTDSEERKDRRTSSTSSGRGGRSSPTGGTDSTMDSQERKDRRTSSGGRRGGGGGGSRTPATNPPGLTGGMNPTMQVPTGTKFCNGVRVPLSFNCPPRRVGKPKPTPPPPPPQPTVTKFPSSGPPRRVGKAKPQPDKPIIKRVGKRKPTPEPRVNYGASKNDNKPINNGPE